MAGVGRAPKDPAQRRRYGQPARGEWVELPPLERPVLPDYPMAWTKRDRKGIAIPKWIWDLWRSDPVTSQWTPADLATCLELGSRYYEVDDSERRLVQTSLGLNAKGRRDLRWRTALEAKEQAEAGEKAKQVRRLRVVADKEAKKDAG